MASRCSRVSIPTLAPRRHTDLRLVRHAALDLRVVGPVQPAQPDLALDLELAQLLRHLLLGLLPRLTEHVPQDLLLVEICVCEIKKRVKSEPNYEPRDIGTTWPSSALLLPPFIRRIHESQSVFREEIRKVNVF